MRKKTKREQEEYVPGRARELARTGKFSGWHSIEGYLRFEENCHRARDILDDPIIRKELDQLCKEAREESL